MVGLEDVMMKWKWIQWVCVGCAWGVGVVAAGGGEGVETKEEGQEGKNGTEVLVVDVQEAIAWALEGNRGLAVEKVGVERGKVAAEQAWAGIRNWEVAPVGSVREGDVASRREVGVEGRWTSSLGTRVYGTAGAKEWDFEEVGTGHTRRSEVRVGVEQPLLKGFGRLEREEPGVVADEAWRAARRSWERKRSALVVQVVECWEAARYQERQVAADAEQAARL